MHVFSYNVGKMTYAVIHEGCKTTIQGKSKRMLITITFPPLLRRQFRFIKQGFSSSCEKYVSMWPRRNRKQNMVFTSQSCTFQSLYPSQALLSCPVRFLLQSMTTIRLWALSITNLPCPVNQDGVGPPKLLHFLLPSNISWQLVEFPASPHCMVSP